MDKMDRDQAGSDEQREDHKELRRERDYRGDARDRHLEAGRDLAQSENEQTRKRNLTRQEEVTDDNADDRQANQR